MFDGSNVSQRTFGEAHVVGDCLIADMRRAGRSLECCFLSAYCREALRKINETKNQTHVEQFDAVLLLF